MIGPRPQRQRLAEPRSWLRASRDGSSPSRSGAEQRLLVRHRLPVTRLADGAVGAGLDRAGRVPAPVSGRCDARAAAGSRLRAEANRHQSGLLGQGQLCRPRPLAARLYRLIRRAVAIPRARFAADTCATWLATDHKRRRPRAMGSRGWPEGIIRPELLSDPTVRVLAVRDEQAVTTGAIINRTGATVGVSNVFTTAATPASAWRDLAAAVGDLFAGVPIVGYEHGNALAAAVESGFEPIAPLRVWLTPAT